MSLKLERLLIKIKTIDGGTFGLDIPFEQGLVVIRLDNTHGKSTCLNSIAYALGMEKGIGATSRFPFTPVMNRKLAYKGKEYDVLSSEVYLEISNYKDTYTLRRDIHQAAGDTSLIQVQKSKIENFSEILSTPYYLDKPDDTTSERGFYYWLSQFVGWDLPMVPTTDGKDRPLYPSTIFSMLFVEQKRGWTGIQATLPYYFKIKDVRKRVIEFIMDLGVHDLLVKKQRLKSKQNNLYRYWEQWHSRLTNKARLVNGSVIGFKTQPKQEFIQSGVDVEILVGKKHMLLDDLLAEKEASLQIVKNKRVAEKDASLDITLVKAQIAEQEVLLQVAQDNFDEENRKLQFIAMNVTSVRSRLASLNENKRKYEDLRKVNQLNLLDNISLEDGTCPACEQPVADALLPNIAEHDVMSAKESLTYLKNQIKTFGFILENSETEFEQQQRKVNTQRDELFAIKTEIRRLKSTITDVSKTNLEEQIREEVRLEEYIARLTDVRTYKEQVKAELKKLHDEYIKNEASLNRIPKNGLSQEDKKKLFKLKDILIEHEKQYGFSSFQPSDLNISFDSYLPTLDKYDLGFDTSASDGIRIIWGYLLSMLELSRTYNINHPGLVIFDEPRQQDADQVSFSSLLSKAAESKKFNQQVILATSEKSHSLEEVTKGLDFKLIDLTDAGEKIMRPLKID